VRPRGEAGVGVAAGAGGGAAGGAGGGTAAGGIAAAGIAGAGDGVAVRTGVGMAGTRGIGIAGVTRPDMNDSGAAAASDSRTARSVTSQPGDIAGADVAAMPTRITAPQTEQRARTPPGGTFAGSTRKTELHSAHETFTDPPSPWRTTPV
jgi:type IV secretion system protein TrbL